MAEEAGIGPAPAAVFAPAGAADWGRLPSRRWWFWRRHERSRLWRTARRWLPPEPRAALWRTRTWISAARTETAAAKQRLRYRLWQRLFDHYFGAVCHLLHSRHLSGGCAGGSYSSGSTAASTIVRTKLTDSHSYDSNDVADDLGWFDSVSNTESRLKDFYDKTGVQPYVYLKAYDSSLTGDAEKESWAKNFYDTTLDDEDGFLFVYFAEEDQDEDVGYMAYVAGSRAQSVMDSEAVDIFWSYIDRYWSTDMSTDDVIYESFTDTATAIMHVSTTKADLSKYRLLAIIVVGGGAVIFLILREKNRRAHEKAKETESILNTPLEEAAQWKAAAQTETKTEKNSVDDLIDHYNKT